MEKILGISLGHDTNFSLVQDGKVLGIIEVERFYRQKRYKLHAHTLQPGKRAVGFQNVDVTDLLETLDQIAKAWGTEYQAVVVQNQFDENEFQNLLQLLRQRGFTFSQTHLASHHQSHAALAYFTSPFSESLVLSFDGYGNDGQTVIFHAQGNRLEYIFKAPTRFGLAYKNLGYIVDVKPDVSGSGSGKTMGLAAYGKVRQEWLPYARKYIQQYKTLPKQKFEGLDAYGKGHEINSIGLDEIPELQEFVTEVPRVLKQGFGGLWTSLVKGKTRRVLKLPAIDHPLSLDLIETVQKAWTDLVLELLHEHASLSRNIAVVGGCALNGVTNYVIENSKEFDRAYFVPNPTDCGLSAGSALHYYYSVLNHPFNGSADYFSPYLGLPAFDLDRLPEFKSQYSHRELTEAEVPAVLADLIFRDRIVGVIRGRYEVGPRALGNRSILSNPLNPQMREVLNHKVKHREWYRPFAPVAVAEESSKYFTNQNDIPYMSVICYTRQEYREKLPSITHIDGSARLQTLREAQNPYLYQTLREFEKRSGFPILLNTSFNPGGEPIVNFAAVALKMLDETELDLVLIENTLFCRKGREEVLH